MNTVACPSNWKIEPYTSGFASICVASFTRYRTGKLSVPSTTRSYSPRISNAFDDVRIVSCVITSTSGLIALRRSLADTTLGRPTSSVSWRSWRCRFVRSTLSKSRMPSVPTPAAARYIATGDPSPPAPMQRTFASRSLRCPAAPMFGRMMWREYLRTCSSVKAPPWGIEFIPPSALPPSRCHP